MNLKFAAPVPTGAVCQNFMTACFNRKSYNKYNFFLIFHNPIFLLKNHSPKGAIFTEKIDRMPLIFQFNTFNIRANKLHGNIHILHSYTYTNTNIFVYPCMCQNLRYSTFIKPHTSRRF